MKGLLQQLDSARADCQFLATSHAESLRGLHGEIDSLQRSNRQLQFQITFESEADKVNRLETAVDQLQLANTKCESQLEEQVRAKVIESKIVKFYVQRRKSETKLSKARSQADQLHKRIGQLEDELKRTIGSYQTLVVSLEKQNEQQGKHVQSSVHTNT